MLQTVDVFYSCIQNTPGQSWWKTEKIYWSEKNILFFALCEISDPFLLDWLVLYQSWHTDRYLLHTLPGTIKFFWR